MPLGTVCHYRVHTPVFWNNIVYISGKFDRISKLRGFNTLSNPNISDSHVLTHILDYERSFPPELLTYVMVSQLLTILHRERFGLCVCMNRLAALRVRFRTSMPLELWFVSV